MISIIRMLTNGESNQLWSTIIDQKDPLQSALDTKGRLLYLTKRAGFNEASLLVHTNDLNALTELMIAHLSTMKEISAISVIHLFRPKFFPIPKDTSHMKRFVITIKAKPKHRAEIYRKLLNPNVPKGLRKVYYGFTFHHYEDDFQYSILADDEETMQEFVDENIDTMDGVTKTKVCPIEKTQPFISYRDYKEWLQHTSGDNSTPGWHSYLEHHFEEQLETSA